MLLTVISDAVIALFSAFVITYLLSLSFYLIFLSDGKASFSFGTARRRIAEIAGKEKECLKK
ncbi:MAG: hypothetical protein IIV97_05395 [Oscillospiraceae bacterium]|nr:hypothetical protein [Oscillospiraceae bacterium]